MGVSPGICAYSKECGHAGVMEHNGDVYSCDHFVFPESKLGNIRDHSLIAMLYEMCIRDSSNPDFTFGWNNTVTYKNWDFNMFCNAAFGAKRCV